MVRKPGEMGYVTELLNKTLSLPAADVLAYAKAKGVAISTSKIYNFRWLAKKAKSHEAPKQLPAAPKSTALAKVKRGKIKRRRSKKPAQISLSKPMGIEQQMLNIVIKVGTIRARELIDQTESTICAKLGITLPQR